MSDSISTGMSGVEGVGHSVGLFRGFLDIAVFSSFFEQRMVNFLLHGVLRFAIFPLVATMSWVSALISLVEAYRDPSKSKIINVVSNVIVSVLVTTSVVLSLVFEIAFAPLFFIAAFAFSTLKEIAEVGYHAYKAVTVKDSAQKLEHRSKALAGAAAVVIGGVLIGAVSILMVKAAGIANVVWGALSVAALTTGLGLKIKGLYDRLSKKPAAIPVTTAMVEGAKEKAKNAPTVEQVAIKKTTAANAPRVDSQPVFVAVNAAPVRREATSPVGSEPDVARPSDSSIKRFTSALFPVVDTKERGAATNEEVHAITVTA